LVQHYHRQQKKQKTTPVAASTPVTTASPYNIAQPLEVACVTIFSPMLEPTVAAVHMAAASPTITAHIPQPTGASGSNIPDQELLRRPTFISDDYDETVDKLWDDWYKEGIKLIVQDIHVSEKWRTEWSVKDNKKFSRLKFIVEYIQARSEEKPVGLVIDELKKLQGRNKLSTLEHKLKDHIKLAGGK
jgi:hypothetical protein